MSVSEFRPRTGSREKGTSTVITIIMFPSFIFITKYLWLVSLIQSFKLFIYILQYVNRFLPSLCHSTQTSAREVYNSINTDTACKVFNFKRILKIFIKLINRQYRHSPSRPIFK